MPHVDILYNQLQKRITGAIKLTEAIVRFQKNIFKKRHYLDNLFENSDNTQNRQKINENKMIHLY